MIDPKVLNSDKIYFLGFIVHKISKKTLFTNIRVADEKLKYALSGIC